jgi:hypothetical protein
MKRTLYFKEDLKMEFKAELNTNVGTLGIITLIGALLIRAYGKRKYKDGVKDACGTMQKMLIDTLNEKIDESKEAKES